MTHFMSNKDFNKFLREVKCKVDNTPKNAPSQRRLVKQFSFSARPSSEQLIIWNYIWNHSDDLWTSAQAFLFLELKMRDKEFLADSWDVIKQWQTKVENWGMCDALSKIFTKVLEIIPENVLNQLKQWNTSANPWDRRQSVVSLLYFSRTKKVLLPFDTIINLVNELVNDPDYYVQKAVGWSLKELYNVYPKETLQYMQNKGINISAIAFTIAIEKFTLKDKERIKNFRKLSRRHT